MEWFEIAMVLFLAILIVRIIVAPFIIVGMTAHHEEPVKVGAVALNMLLNVFFAVALYLTVVRV